MILYYSVCILCFLVMAGLGFLLGREHEQRRFCETMTAFFKCYEEGLKDQNAEFRRGVYFINGFLIENYLRDKGDAM